MEIVRRVNEWLKTKGTFGEFLWLVSFIIIMELAWQILRLIITGHLPFDWLWMR